MPPSLLVVGGYPPSLSPFLPFHCWSVLCTCASCTFITRFTVGQGYASLLSPVSLLGKRKRPLLLHPFHCWARERGLSLTRFTVGQEKEAFLLPFASQDHEKEAFLLPFASQDRRKRHNAALLPLRTVERGITRPFLPLRTVERGIMRPVLASQDHRKRHNEARFSVPGP